MRFKGLDVLRAFCAFGIMVYHFCNISGIEISANSVIGKFQMYGVPVFYIISGFVLFHAYQNSAISLVFIKTFFKKRFWRIMPLFWLASILKILISRDFDLTIKEVVLNFSGLFGLIAPNVYLPIGGWSIGNEIFFYCAFPLIIWLDRKSKISLYIVNGFAMLLFGFFTFYVFEPDTHLNYQWASYVNPFNQIIFFFAGILMAKHLEFLNSLSKYTYYILFVLSILFFGLVETSELSISLVTGYYRIAALISSLFIVLFFIQFNEVSESNFLVQLGRASYSIYILHPIIFSLTVYILRSINFHEQTYFVIITGAVFTTLLSLISYHYVEKRFLTSIRN